MTDGATPEAAEIAAAEALLTAGAVKERTARLFAHVEDGHSDHFRFEPDAMGAIAATVAKLTRARFPDLAVPLHSRWRHFEVGGRDRFASLAAAREWQNEAEAARAMGDLAIVSVLLDAGAGPRWRYHETVTGETIGRSEGLGLASFAMFASGAFSAVPADPLRADAEGLETLTQAEFATGMQLSPDNPLDGAENRRLLLTDLAAALRERPDLFASEDDPRPGGLIDRLAAEAVADTLPAPAILAMVLDGLGPIWPSRLELGGVPLGDTWAHPALTGSGPGANLVPFHKLSTWLSLSLIEPLGARGLSVTDLDDLPGPAEYRNGGLFVDGGALRLRDPSAATTPHTVDEPLIVEWRAATVTLLARLAPMVREVLGASDEELPLAALLEGGTWFAGREMAKARSADASSPIAIVSDGTVF